MNEEPISAHASAAVAGLIAQRKWTEAVDALRSRLFDGRTPSVQGRLQLVDLMVSAGRGKEAVPILLGIADELVSERFLAKAVAVLKRVDRIQPGREDVRERLMDLVRTQSQLAAEHPLPGQDGRARPGTVREAVPTAAVAVQREEPASASPEPSGPAAGSAAIDADERLRGVLREFLGLNVGDVTLPVGRLKAADVLARVEQERAAGRLRAPTSSVGSQRGPGVRAAGAPRITAVPELTSGTAYDEAPAAGGTAESDARAEAEILDLVADVLRQPVHEVAHEDDPQSEAARVTRLLAAPLFSGLSAAELLAVVHGLALRTFEPGDVIVTEGEPGRSLFVLTSGRARVFVRSRDGHAVEVGSLDEGDFFGEIAALSGARRGATITTAEACEVLELDKATLDAIALAHPRVRAMIEATYLDRAGNATVAGVRDAKLAARQAPARAVEVLEARFGEGQWDPRMRLELADALLRSGKHDEAVPILVGLADELARHGQIAKAIALVKKVERIQNRHVEELLLAPLPAQPSAEAAAGAGSEHRPAIEAAHPFERWLLRLAQDGLCGSGGAQERRGTLTPPTGYRPGLRASPLFAGLSEEELLSLVSGLRLVSRQAGDIIVSEGEAGESLFVLAAGAVKVMTLDADGHNVPVCRLDEGAFFGEIAALSDAPRSATVVAAEACELLELDRKTLGEVAERHPRVREVLDQAFVERGGDAAARAHKEQ